MNKKCEMDKKWNVGPTLSLYIYIYIYMREGAFLGTAERERECERR